MGNVMVISSPNGSSFAAQITPRVYVPQIASMCTRVVSIRSSTRRLSIRLAGANLPIPLTALMFASSNRLTALLSG